MYPGTLGTAHLYWRDTGIPRSQETASPEDPVVGLYLGSYGGPRGGGVFFMSEVPLQAATGLASFRRFLDCSDAARAERESSLLTTYRSESTLPTR